MQGRLRAVRDSLAGESVKWARMAAHRAHPRLERGFQRLAIAMDGDTHRARRLRGFLRAARPGALTHLNYLALGTTGTCNASCVHCPTGKASTAASPRGTMPMEIFTRIVDGIVDLGLRVDDQIGLGLFGDGLVDPLVVERARYLRERLPEVRLTINTNGAAFNARKHGALAQYATVVALHCESLTPATYDYLMTPLRAKNVHPKYEQILTAFPGKVLVSVPVSRANLSELPAIRDWFMARGAQRVEFDPLSNRCAEDQSVFDALSLAPMRIACPESATANLIVDCDGLVLTCCQDFSRIDAIGDLSRETLEETLRSTARAARARQFAEGRHAEISTCSRCVGDCRTPAFPFDQVAPGGAAEHLIAEAAWG